MCSDQTDKVFKDKNCFLITKRSPVTYILRHLINKLGPKGEN